MNWFQDLIQAMGATMYWGSIALVIACIPSALFVIALLVCKFAETKRDNLFKQSAIDRELRRMINESR